MKMEVFFCLSVFIFIFSLNSLQNIWRPKQNLLFLPNRKILLSHLPVNRPRFYLDIRPKSWIFGKTDSNSTSTSGYENGRRNLKVFLGNILFPKMIIAASPSDCFSWTFPPLTSSCWLVHFLPRVGSHLLTVEMIAWGWKASPQKVAGKM